MPRLRFSVVMVSAQKPNSAAVTPVYGWKLPCEVLNSPVRQRSSDDKPESSLTRSYYSLDRNS
ncbi:hypothetical protein SAMN05444171_0930 [Bradyrhizobium lablabi]|uniref:Uncharacterized protein n=2 Tax=Bradyrhizobium TaxID=374 RepID=A0ABY0Q8T3_9BRAD|nr:hypothetical protein SAMN05444163_6230 [Bradyrhizobium ottawaense]SEC22591.1 hypothetical protein SAMN05444171_0930 [Bradyrhizobium lablabi]